MSVPQTSPIKILLVDDHPFLRQGVAMSLTETENISIIGEADSAEAAMQFFQQTTELPDVVITDLSLPDKSGLELVRSILTSHPEMPILVLSMHEEDIYAERCLRAGAKGFLMKSQGPESLTDAIRTVHAGRIYVSANLAQKLVSMLTAPTPSHAQKESPIQELSDREFEVFELVGRGKTAKEIAGVLNLSSKTVDVHRARIRTKLNLTSTTDLTHYAVRWVQAREGGSEI
jgi:DNA-binding NarL/FixJ family response regulator